MIWLLGWVLIEDYCFNFSRSDIVFDGRENILARKTGEVCFEYHHIRTFFPDLN